MPRIAVVGNLSRDRIDGGDPQPGGCPPFAALALELLAREGQILTRFAAADHPLFEAFLTGSRSRVTTLDATTTSAFSLDYRGQRRTTRVDAVGDPWTPLDIRHVERRATWVHVAPLLRGEFPAETLAALAASGRHVSFDGQGLVRVPRPGPLWLDGHFDRELLRRLTVLKLAEDEAAVLAPDGFDADAAAVLGAPEILVTLASGGCDVYASGAAARVPAARPVLGVQTTGAGDVFMVAYVAARSDGADPRAAAASASEVVARMLEQRKRRER